MKIWNILFVILFNSCNSANSEDYLTIPNDGFEFSLEQRHSIQLPSHLANTYCEIDDITGGQTILTIKSSESIIISRSISEGDIINFSISNKTYNLECIELKNYLIGDDFAIFKISEDSAKTEIKLNNSNENIELFIQKISNSNVIFIRNGVEHNSQEAAEHLKNKWKNDGSNSMKLDDFISKYATKSSLSGEFYKVKLASGEEIMAVDWYKTLQN